MTTPLGSGELPEYPQELSLVSRMTNTEEHPKSYYFILIFLPLALSCPHEIKRYRDFLFLVLHYSTLITSASSWSGESNTYEIHLWWISLLWFRIHQPRYIKRAVCKGALSGLLDESKGYISQCLHVFHVIFQVKQWVNINLSRAGLSKQFPHAPIGQGYPPPFIQHFYYYHSLDWKEYNRRGCVEENLILC